MRARAVIGSSWGDEGKGLMTDYFASLCPEPALVVRYNGGAQAGHSCQVGDQRHIFSHIGAGALAGADTYLSQFFICNPLLFQKEMEQLKQISPDGLTQIFVDENCLVTSPFEMEINRMVERRRGASRHGSCGVGINETVVRNLIERTTWGELWEGKSNIIEWMANGRERGLHRLDQLGFGEEEKQEFANKFVGFTEAFSKAYRYFIDRIQTVSREEMRRRIWLEKRQVIFEGAQGLLLDENNLPEFPHLTRSKTGLENVIFLAERLGISELEAVYVTRTYLTRHGAGDLPGECSSDLLVKDKTNITNEFQGTPRFAPMDWYALEDRIDKDFDRARLRFPNIKQSLAITWQDQIEVDPKLIVHEYASFGPSRMDVREVKHGA